VKVISLFYYSIALLFQTASFVIELLNKEEEEENVGTKQVYLAE
jgi:hypothetical protein